MRPYIYLIISLCLLNSYGQEQTKVDSLRVMKLLEESSKKLDTTIKLQNFEMALNESKKIKFNYGIYASHKKIADLKKAKYTSDSAISEYKKILKLLPKNNRYSYWTIQLISTEFLSKSEYDSVLHYNNKLIKLGEKYSNSTIVVDAYIANGNLWLQRFEYDKSFQNYLIADSICEKDPELKISKERAIIYNYLGYSVRKSSGYRKAIDYYIKAKEVHEKLGNIDGVQEVNIAIAQAYTSFKDYDKALKLLNESIAHHKKYMPTQNSYSYGVIVRGYLLLEMERYKDAERDYLLYYDLAVESKNEYYERAGLAYLGYFYKSSNNPKQAIKYYNLAIEKNQLVDDYGKLLQIIEELIEVHKTQKNYKEIIENYELLLNVQKQFDTKNIAQETRSLETKYQTEKKVQEIALLKSQNALTIQKQKSQRSVLLGGIVLTSLAGIFIFILYRNRRKTNDKLRELDSAKSRFFENISHEFRTPLALIQGPIDDQLEKEQLGTQEKANLKIAKKNAIRLLTLVDQILDLSKLESGQFKLNVQYNNLKTFLDALLSSFSYQAEKHQQTFNYRSSISNAHFWFDADVLEKIICNLISNAIKYSPINAEIKIDINVSEEKQLEFSIQNSGVQLTETELNHIFSRFYSTAENGNAVGTGIGLALTKELVERHKGTIAATSTKENVRFVFKIPVYENAFLAEEIVSQPTALDTSFENFRMQQRNDVEEHVVNEAIFQQKNDQSEHTEDLDQPILLIVDDNEDLRTYIKSIFEQRFQVITASDGFEGLKVALAKVPDLIITDLMMPNEDGLKFTEKCKINPITSHIPLVMLTAKAGDENTLIGLETGADAYLTKPFNTKILKATVDNLLENRKKLQDRFSQEVILMPKDIAINSVDEQFITNLQTVLDEQLVESDFNAESFAKALYMSRMQLHRKLKAVTGKTATEFIRFQRLKLAASLLKKSDANISEIGYSVGFNNHSYFTKCFKEHYGVSPTDFSKSS